MLPAEVVADLPRGAAVYGRAYAQGLEADAERGVDEWAADRRHVAAESGSPFPGPWSNARAPYLVEIQRALSLSHPCRRVTVRKSAQVGVTECGVNLFGQIVDETPAPMMIVLPSIEEGKAYNRLKLQPTIDATPALKEKVVEVKSRDAEASTGAFKRFRGGYCQITGANSSKGLQMRSVRVIVFEEISEYPFDVDQRGDPVDLAEKRNLAWRGREKVFENSTPGLEGACRISASYEKSSKGAFHVECPHCGEEQTLEFSQLTYEDESPEAAVYVCRHNGCVIEHHHKAAMVAGGRWVHERPELVSVHIGFRINQLYSPFVAWVETAREEVETRDIPAARKVYVQQVRGEAYAEDGDSPDHEKLKERREDYKLGILPPGALFLSGAVDVQHNRLEWCVFAWGVGLTSWLVGKGILEGDPAEPEVWMRLEEVLERRYVDSRGKGWPVDAWAIDAGYMSSAVYRFVARHAAAGRVFAIDGRPGWKLPPLGTPTPRAVDFQGRKVGTAMLWPLGTWDMKSELYASLRKTIKGPDEDGTYRIGYAHFPDACDEDYFKQLTAEWLKRTPTRKGLEVLEWVKAGGQANEAHDIAVYARALAHHLSDSLTPEAWASLAARRGAEVEQVQLDLARLWSPGLEAEAAAEGSAPAPAGRPRRRPRIRTRGGR